MVIVFNTFSECYAPCNSAPPIHTWPLSFNTETNDVENNVTSGNIGSDVTYGAPDPSINGTAASFNGEENSFVDVRLEETSMAISDFSLGMYIFMENTVDGILFQFKGDASAPKISTITAYVKTGNVVIDLGDFGNATSTNINLNANMWYNIIVVRDKSKNSIDVMIDRTANNNSRLNFGNISNIDLSIPGTLRLGKTFVEPSPVTPLHGRIMCVQVTLGKLKPDEFSDSCYDYDNKCNTDPIMPTTSTTTTTAIPQPTTQIAVASTTTTPISITMTSTTLTSTSSTPVQATSQISLTTTSVEESTAEPISITMTSTTLASTSSTPVQATSQISLTTTSVEESTAEPISITMISTTLASTSSTPVQATSQISLTTTSVEESTAEPTSNIVTSTTPASSLSTPMTFIGR
ncbi:hypothetical protein DPMN_000634 [Dreissena polymorpha]|uniref:Uncharacterized protein n=1 Tax=Dreissena polymorpha TaxID=45954 RepID=A0A9D4MIM5_DREPO|nr:hypothetical protein DPMN_000634 [Dreissena polymorpha]